MSSRSPSATRQSPRPAVQNARRVSGDSRLCAPASRQVCPYRFAIATSQRSVTLCKNTCRSQCVKIAFLLHLNSTCQWVIAAGYEKTIAYSQICNVDVIKEKSHGEIDLLESRSRTGRIRLRSQLNDEAARVLARASTDRLR